MLWQDELSCQSTRYMPIALAVQRKWNCRRMWSGFALFPALSCQIYVSYSLNEIAQKDNNKMEQKVQLYSCHRFKLIVWICWQVVSRSRSKWILCYVKRHIISNGTSAQHQHCVWMNNHIIDVCVIQMSWGVCAWDVR